MKSRTTCLFATTAKGESAMNLIGLYVRFGLPKGCCVCWYCYSCSLSLLLCTRDIRSYLFVLVCQGLTFPMPGLLTIYALRFGVVTCFRYSTFCFWLLDAGNLGTIVGVAIIEISNFLRSESWRARSAGVFDETPCKSCACSCCTV